MFKDNKTKQAHGVSEICSLWKFSSAYYTKLQEESCYYLLIIYIIKTSQKVKTEDV